MHHARTLGLGAVALAIAGCAASLSGTMKAELTLNGSGTYAAMDEIEVGGGELRLATPIIEIDVEGVEQEIIGFPLRHTAVHADVAGPMATFTVEQTFENPFDEPIEAVYVFPLSDDAAISGYAIQIGERTIVGEIRERDVARRVYAQARAAGHTAALLEQDKPDVFAQRIANIAPHEVVTIRLEYVELVTHVDGAYALTVPLVVGPRYLPAGRRGRRPVAAHHAGDVPRAATTSIAYSDAARQTSTVSFTAAIDAGVPVLGVESPSHDLDVDDVAPTRVRVALARADEPPDRDLVVRWRSSGDRTTVGVLADRAAAGGDGHFVLVVQPKAAYRTGDVAAREVLLLVDVSGSMEGVPLEQARAVAAAVVDTLTERDTFNILGFASGLSAMADGPVRGDASGRARGAAFLASLGAGGGTELEGGILAALQGQADGGRVRMVYLLTDGWVGNDDVIIDAARGALGHNRIFAVGIGSAPNRALLDRLSVVGRGFASYLGTTEAAGGVAGALVRRSSYPYLTDVSIDWGGLQVREVTPGVIPDVYAGMPLIVAGKYREAGRATVTFRATAAGKPVSIPIEVTLPAQHEQPAVAQLWARHRIEELMTLATSDGIPDGVAAELTQLGLGYHLVTERTSFIAVDRTRVVASDGQVRVVEQPAATPEGVNLAAAVGDVAEPVASSSSGSRSSYDGSSSGGGWSRGWGGGGGGGGDADPWTLLLVALLAPLVWRMRRAHA